MTIDSKQIVQEILENDGIYPGDPQCYAVYSYVNDWNKKTYSVACSSRDTESLYSSPCCHIIILLWEQGSGLTAAGVRELQEMKSSH
jgi:hypothetical protein